MASEEPAQCVFHSEDSAVPDLMTAGGQPGGLDGSATDGLDLPDHSFHDCASQTSADSSPSPRHPSPGRASTWPRSLRRAPPRGLYAHDGGGGGGGGGRRFPRLARPVELLRGSYDCVVVGSGYGGAVAASRAARAGEAVCVLERGREKWPGEYPSGTRGALAELHWSGGGGGGDPTGMYHLVLGKGQHAVVGNGLGGTSLINANVFLEANRDALRMKAWPAEIRNNPECLDRYYQMARDVLEPQAYPSDWPELAKLELLKKQAECLGIADKYRRVEQTTRFRNGQNSCGVAMAASALTGQDATGVNDGSKTTTLVTYLADAWNFGAELFCQCEVRYVEKCSKRGGWNVYFAWHGRNRGRFRAHLDADLMFVHAKKAVFLGAGALGTSEILLRSKQLGLSMSDSVGRNMSGNGDLLAFGHNTDVTVNAVGRPFPSPHHPVGPCITGIIDNREGHENPLDGYVVEEGTIPRALAPWMRLLDLVPGMASSEASYLQKAKAKLARWGSSILGRLWDRNGAMERTQVYLVLSHDHNQAMLRLQHDKPELEFLGVGRSDRARKLHDVLAQAIRAVGGSLVQSPFSSVLGQQEVTVHPIGGACMARDGTPQTGVTNHYGEVFVGHDRDSTETHDGLVVVDGSVLPSALGANPLATIAALAERSVEAYCAKRGLVGSQEKNTSIDLFGEPAHQPRRHRGKTQAERALARAELDTLHDAARVIRSAEATNANGFGFTETMSGFIHHDERGMQEDVRETYDVAYRMAKSRCESARFFLSVQAFDTEEIVSNPEHQAMLTGTFVCASIPGSPFMVTRGTFHLFKLDHKAPGTRNFTYDFDMSGVNGELLHFHGYKVVDSSVALAPLQFWRSTTTLYVTISQRTRTGPIDRGEDAWRKLDGVAKGIMHMQPADFLAELLTLTPTGSSRLQTALSAASFMTFFTRTSLRLFLAPFGALQYPSSSYRGYVNPTRPDRSFDIHAADGVATVMHMWDATAQPHDGSAVQDLFFIPGASVDHQIFALPTIPYNTVNYFARAGYRVFVSVHRIGQLKIAENGWTTYDARLDIKACLSRLREIRRDEHVAAHQLSADDLATSNWQPPKTYCVAHCMGSVAFACGLLDGTIPASWIKGVTCSQVFMHPIWTTANMIKAAGLGPIPLDRLYTLLAGTSWFSCAASRADRRPAQRALDQALRLLGPGGGGGGGGERCASASCHRISLAFGRCWSHRNLNAATHRHVDRLFGGVGMPLLRALVRAGRAGHVLATGGTGGTGTGTGTGTGGVRLTAPRNVRRLRGVPVLLFVGAENAVLSAAATERSYEALCDAFGIGGEGEGEDDGDGEGVAYRRRVVPGYGHLDCWIGRNAWKDVYPMVREEVDRVCRGEAYRFREPEDRFKRMVDSGELLS